MTDDRWTLNSPVRWTLAALSLLVAGSWTLQADSRKPAADGGPQASQTFRSGTQIVQVDVRVLENGRFVTDLGPSDFTIKEDGVAQKVESVVLVAAPSASAPSAPALATRSAAASAPSAPALWVFVFDT